MKPSEVLRAAKGLIDAPEKLIKGAYFRRGSERNYYCSAGAIETASATDPAAGDQAINYLCMATGLLAFTGITNWNDAPERTWEEVMEAFDRAIAAAQKAGE